MVSAKLLLDVGRAVSDHLGKDHTIGSGLDRVCMYLDKSQQAKYSRDKWRVRIIKYSLHLPLPILMTLINAISSAWRPLRYLVEASPLIFCDPALAKTEDLIATDLLLATGDSSEVVGNLYYLSHDAEYRWYYLDAQSPEEVAIFTQYDSHPSGHLVRLSSDIWTSVSTEVRIIVINKVGN